MGSRIYATSWVVDGKVWIFGGRGYVAQTTTSAVGFLSDLWRYDPPSTMTFIGGATTLNKIAVYPQRFILWCGVQTVFNHSL